jgi:hypothetical protein
VRIGRQGQGIGRGKRHGNGKEEVFRRAGEKRDPSPGRVQVLLQVFLNPPEVSSQQGLFAGMSRRGFGQLRQPTLEEDGVSLFPFRPINRGKWKEF